MQSRSWSSLSKLYHEQIHTVTQYWNVILCRLHVWRIPCKYSSTGLIHTHVDLSSHLCDSTSTRFRHMHVWGTPVHVCVSWTDLLYLLCRIFFHIKSLLWCLLPDSPPCPPLLFPPLHLSGCSCLFLKPCETRPVCPSQEVLGRMAASWHQTAPKLCILAMPPSDTPALQWSPPDCPENQKHLPCLRDTQTYRLWLGYTHWPTCAYNTHTYPYRRYTHTHTNM